MVLGSAFVPFCMSIPSAFGFFLMALPIVVSARYLSRKFVWETVPSASHRLARHRRGLRGNPRPSLSIGDGGGEALDRIAFDAFNLTVKRSLLVVSPGEAAFLIAGEQ